jgi:sulfite reductase subunit B
VYLPTPARILGVTRQTSLENLYDVRRDDGRRLGHAPGQFVQVSVFGVGECPISVCSSPTRPDSFQLTVRRVGEVTTAIHRLEPGDEVGIRGPLGHGFDVQRFFDHDIIIVAGGCALAPARSLIHYILDERTRFGAFHLLYGARSPEEMLFRDELTDWQARTDINCHITIDRPDDGWDGSVGLVTTLFDHLPRIDLRNTRAVVIGPPAMFRFVMMKLLALGVAQKHVYCSLERRMKCGIGKCGHCQVNQLYACLDGPVFNFAEISRVREAIQ